MWIRGLIAMAVLAYGGIAVWCLIDPVTPMADVGLAPTDDRGFVEIAAMYGGLQLGMGAFLVWTVVRGQLRSGILAAALSIGGLGVARLIGWLAYQPEGGLIPLLCAIEVSGGVLGALALGVGKPEDTPTSEGPFDRPIVALYALGFFLFALWFLVDPTASVSALGLAPTDDRGVVELRAMYGGLNLGCTAYFLWTVTNGRARTGLWMGALSVGGLGTCRTLAWLLYQPEGWLHPLFASGEIGAAMVTAAVLLSRRSAP